MIIYLALTLPWMALVTAASLRPDTKRRRRWLMYGFTATLPFLVWQFHRHAVSKIPGGDHPLRLKLIPSVYTLRILRVVAGNLGCLL